MRELLPQSRFRRRLLASLSLIASVYACSSLRSDFAKPPSHALDPPVASATAQVARDASAEHARASGFRLLIDNNDALMSRIALADRAQRSIDVQYYIFYDDATGRLVAQRLLAAADRGVRVRILIDDLDVADADRLLDALDVHQNIEVRLFNPFRTRNPSLLSKLGQFLVDGRRLNRRMHNKSFIVDNSAAIVGGRNIGDAYFDGGDSVHFRDLDVIAIGPVVRETSRAFDTYWNDEAAFPVTAFASTNAGPQELAKARALLRTTARAPKRSEYAAALAESLPGGSAMGRAGQWMWGDAVLVADQPEKIQDDGNNPALRMGPKLKAMMNSAQHEVLLISSYFVPGDADTQFFTTLAKRGVKVKLLTNSLAATDEPMVHAGYSRYRHDLLAGGVELYELRPLIPRQPPAHGTSSGVSLHAKAVVVDRRFVFIGSMNLDLRSKLLNTEMGVIADCPELAAATAEYFEHAANPQNAFQVVLDRSDKADPHMRWRWADASGKPALSDHEPYVSAWRRVEVDFLRLLPIDGLL